MMDEEVPVGFVMLAYLKRTGMVPPDARTVPAWLLQATGDFGLLGDETEQQALERLRDDEELRGAWWSLVQMGTDVTGRMAFVLGRLR